MRKTSILASLLNAVVLLMAMGAIAWESLQRFAEPSAVEGRSVMAVAAIGVLINGITAALFASGRKGELNARSAFLHMAADAGVSVGVICSGALILATGRTWIDPAVSLGIVVIVLFGSWGLLRDSVNLALDAVPEGIDIGAIQQHLRALPGVLDVHDLHIWGLSTTEAALTAHIVVAAHADDVFLVRTEQDLHSRFGIEHATLQIETNSVDMSCHCRLTGRPL
jgi:cobalt-zinc-cadmium efflux system protein